MNTEKTNKNIFTLTNLLCLWYILMSDIVMRSMKKIFMQSVIQFI